MKKMFLLLAIGIFAISGICWATSLDMDMRAAAPGVSKDAPAVDKKVNDAKAEGEAKKPGKPDSGWLGATSPEKAARLVAKSNPGQAVQISPEVLASIKTVMDARGLTITLPEFRVMEQADMEGEVGLVISGNIVVCGKDHYARLSNVEPVIGHELTAHALAIAKASGDHHAIAEEVEREIGKNLPPTQRIINADGENSYLVAKNSASLRQPGEVLRLGVKDGIYNADTMAAIQDFWEAVYGKGNVIITKTDGKDGDIVATRYAADKTTQLGRATVVAQTPKGVAAYRLGGLVNIAVTGSFIPDNLSAQNIGQYQSLLNLYTEQVRSMLEPSVAASWQLPPNPGDIASRVRRLTIELPVPTALSFNPMEEVEASKKFFGVWA